MGFEGEQPPASEITPSWEAKEERKLARAFFALAEEACWLVEERLQEVLPGRDYETRTKRARAGLAVEQLIFARACKILGLSEIAQKHALNTGGVVEDEEIGEQ